MLIGYYRGQYDLLQRGELQRGHQRIIQGRQSDDKTKSKFI